MSYTQLGLDERCLLYALKNAGESVAEIAISLGRHISSIYRELKRNEIEGLLKLEQLSVKK